MSTNLDIIKRAMKKLHVLASGAEPTSAEAADGMEQLQSLLVELIGHGGLGRLADVVVPDGETAYTAFGWSRVKYPSGCTVTLPTYTGDTYSSTGSDTTDYGNGAGYCQSFHDLAPIVTISSAGVPLYYVFNAYGTGWVQVNDLGQQDDFPLAAHYENGFAAMLAEYMVDEFDGTVGADTRRQAAWCRHQLANKQDSEDNVSPSPVEYF